MKRTAEIFLVSFRLGLTSFGGPAAHLGYFREEYVSRKKWIDESRFAEIIALAQFLPGPASSQVGIAIGMTRAGIFGGVAAWLGFTLPSVVILIAFAYGVLSVQEVAGYGWFHGLKVMAVAVVGIAVYGMGRRFSVGLPRMCITVASAGVMVFLGFQNIQLGVILVAALIGWFTTIIKLPVIEETGPIYRGRKAGYISLSIFTVLFFALPVLQQITGNQVIRIFASFYRTGALVFGGGHVVLPLLQESVVVPGWVTQDQFIAGYGLSQAIPGPLFTFSAYLGALMEHFTYPWVGGLLALFAIFLPSFLLVAGILPFWHRIRTKGRVQYSIAAINAAVVGLLLAALYDPIWVNTMVRIEDFLLGGIVMMVLTLFKCPVWFVVLLAAACGQLLTYL